jgi:hypothetical protein
MADDWTGHRRDADRTDHYLFGIAERRAYRPVRGCASFVDAGGKERMGRLELAEESGKHKVRSTY